MKYRLKKYTVEAFQYDGDFIYQDGTSYVPDWAIAALKSGIHRYVNDGQLII